MSLSIIAVLFSLAQMTLGSLGLYLNYTDVTCVDCDAGSDEKYCTHWVDVVCLQASALVGTHLVIPQSH